MPSTRVFAETQAEDDRAGLVRTRNDAKLFSKPDLDKGDTVALLPKGRVLMLDHCHTRLGVSESKDTTSMTQTTKTNTIEVIL